MMLDAQYWILAKKGEIPYRYPVSLPSESQTSLYGDEAVKPKNVILKKIDESVLFVKVQAQVQAQPDKQIHVVQKVYKTTV